MEEEEEEESLFKADAVNEEDLERDRVTQVQKTSSAMLLGGGGDNSPCPAGVSAWPARVSSIT